MIEEGARRDRVDSDRTDRCDTETGDDIRLGGTWGCQWGFMGFGEGLRRFKVEADGGNDLFGAVVSGERIRDNMRRVNVVLNELMAIRSVESSSYC